MPEAQVLEPTPAELAMDRRLISSIFLSLSGAGLEVLIGFIVAHWITITANKTAGWIVSLCCFAMVATGGMLGMAAQRELGGGEDLSPAHGRRVFMAKLALLVAAFSLLVVLGGTAVLLTVRPND